MYKKTIKKHTANAPRTANCITTIQARTNKKCFANKYDVSGRLQHVVSNMSVFPRWVTKSTHRYELLTRLTAPSGSVHALAISNDGRVLACGGEHASLRVQGRALINKQAPGVSNFGISIPGKNFPVRLAITNPEERLAVRPGSWLGQPPRRPSVTEQVWAM